MEQYISKSALVAEIEKLMNRYDSEYDEDSTEVKAAKGNVCHEILCAINSLEVKEVDLDKSLTGFMGRYAYENGGEYPSAIDIAKQFFELGLSVSNKAQKGE